MPKGRLLLLLIPFIGMLLISERERIKAEGRVVELIEATESLKIAHTRLRNRIGVLEVMAEQSVLTEARWEIRRQVIAKRIEDEWKAARLTLLPIPCDNMGGDQ